MEINDAIAVSCLEALEELQLSPDVAGDSSIKALMLKAKKKWQEEAVFLAMQKIREKISSDGVPPSASQVLLVG